MQRMLNDSVRNRMLPSSLYEANICLLLKDAWDECDPANVWPIVLQGDPLSPLLFDIALERLADGFRSHPDIHGIETSDTNISVILYADDFLIYLPNLEESVPNLLNYSKLFGGLPGYTTRTNLSSCLWRITWALCSWVQLHLN